MLARGCIPSGCGWHSTSARDWRRWRDLFGRGTDVEPWVAPEDYDLHDALRGLRREHRAVLLLNAVDGYTQAEIATMLELPTGTVASWLARATVHGVQHISMDGASWEALPFTPGTPGVSGSGSTVLASVVSEGRLVLGGQSHGQAAFWVGEAQ